MVMVMVMVMVIMMVMVMYTRCKIERSQLLSVEQQNIREMGMSGALVRAHLHPQNHPIPSQICQDVLQDVLMSKET